MPMRRDRAEQPGQDLGGAGQGARDLLQIHDREIIVFAGGDMAPLAQQLGHFALHARGRYAVAGRNLDARDVLIAGDATPEGTHRHQHHVVLVHAGRGLALGEHETDHAARDLANPHAVTQRIAAAKQLLAHGLAEQADGATGAHLAWVKTASGGEFPGPDLEVAVVDAIDRGQPALIAGDGRERPRGTRRDFRDTAQFARDGFGVGEAKLRGFGALHADALTGPHDEEVRAQARDIGRHARCRALADGDHGDDRGDADDDAEHGQGRAQQIAPDRAHREHASVADHAPASRSIKPSRKLTRRVA